MVVLITLIFAAFQLYYFFDNIKKLKLVFNFFAKSGKYRVTVDDDVTQLNTSVAAKGSSLYVLISELNEYTAKNHGTTDFSVIQNKTERKIGVLYDDATSRMAFPTYIGLMGTFLGVFVGLWLFSSGLGSSPQSVGVTDDAIGGLINGVLVSMATSFLGLLLTTITNHFAAQAQKKVGKEKDIFFEFIQNELMPSLGVSMVDALNKLHSTINSFEPSFNRVIDRFQTTFDTCTSQFGTAFAQNATVVSEAVMVMGENMDKINDNINLQSQLIKTLRSRGILDTLKEFVSASESFSRVTSAICQFEELQNRIHSVSEELIQAQKTYNESLSVPMQVAEKINSILSRVTEFEKSVNALGRRLSKDDIFATSELKAIRDFIKGIEKKRNSIDGFTSISNEKFERIVKSQVEHLLQIAEQYHDQFAEYAENFGARLRRLNDEIVSRREEFASALAERFSLEDVRREFSNLGKLGDIEKRLKTIESNSVSGDIEGIRETLTELLIEIQKRNKSSFGEMVSGWFGRSKQH